MSEAPPGMEEHVNELNKAVDIVQQRVPPETVWPERYTEAKRSPITNKFELVRSSDLTNKPKDYDWLIKNYIERCNLVEIFGSPESGKSLVALEMGFCIACGIDWNNNEVKQGRVIYIAGEGYGGLARRIKALEEKYDCKANNLFLSKEPAELLDDASAIRVNEAIAEVCKDAVLIVIDTLNRNFGAGDENSTKDMTQFVGNVDYYLKRNSETVLIVHHSGLNNKDRSRGNSSLFGALDLQYQVKKSGIDITLENTKVKDIPKPEAIAFTLKGTSIEWIGEDGEPLTAPVLEPSEYIQASSKPRMSHRDEMALKALRDANEKHGVEPTRQIREAFGGLKYRTVVYIDHWRHMFYPLLDVDGDQEVKKKAFQRTRSKLLQNGKIAMMNDYYWEISYRKQSGRDGT